jgi:hypothetical protein
MLGKHEKVKFSLSSDRDRYILELVHSNICGNINVTSIGGSQYFTNSIDDLSRMTWVVFMKKSEIFNSFKNFFAMVEKQTNRNVKTIRSRNGGEYCSKGFDAFCKMNGILR